MPLIDSWLIGLKKAPELRTSRLLLRPICAGDVANIQKCVNDKRVSNNLSYTPHPYTLEMAEIWTKNVNFCMTNGSCCYWTICNIDTKAFIGSMGLSIFKEQEGCEMHYWVSADEWNKGYCTEASKITIAHVFDTLKAHRIAITHREKNIASKKVIQKCGFIYEGQQRDGLKRFGEFENVMCYSMLKNEYLALKGKGTFL